jgi:hypothetical protein
MNQLKSLSYIVIMANYTCLANKVNTTSHLDALLVVYCFADVVNRRVLIIEQSFDPAF